METWLTVITTIGFPSALTFYLVYKGLPIISNLALAVEKNSFITAEMLNFMRRKFN